LEKKMKKKILVLIVILCVAATASVSAIGIGVRGNYGWGNSAGASLLISPTSDASSPGVHFGIDWWTGDSLHVGLTADFLKLVSADIGSNLEFYIRVGLVGGITLGDELGLNAGLRVPIGLDIDLSPIDIYFEAAPNIGVSVLPGFGLWQNWGRAGIGLRFWF
jgi:hypothetical protein